METLAEASLELHSYDQDDLVLLYMKFGHARVKGAFPLRSELGSLNFQFESDQSVLLAGIESA